VEVAVFEGKMGKSQKSGKKIQIYGDTFPTPCVPAVTKEISQSLDTGYSKLRLLKPSSRNMDKQDVSQPNEEKSSSNRMTAINCIFQFKTGTMCYNEKNSLRSETLDYCLRLKGQIA
jgi:hypothetical protein